jgi:hypothetical protein
MPFLGQDRKTKAELIALRLFERLVVYMSRKGIIRAPHTWTRRKEDYDDPGNSRNSAHQLLLLPMLQRPLLLLRLGL